ncbi:R2-like ligand-binding oxidase [Thermogemmatispora tikiterensis]|uniref:R2-like ligand binding oxidase n=1 Tax=Thermogemmatispora tikiterensis TaxID=1825093 RepID=A0A328VAP4_9CHLR|nr:R2-like ligand-binding oxidase [Thermogemmatispora tikiterensis]RAQ94688.1 ribonucleotide-diphosphate reductase [Thermogemmatispora tikiterensis]
MTQSTHAAFITTSERGLRHDILPMRLYHKAKKLGIWDPRAIDFSQDIQDWQRLNEGERETLLYLSSLFQAGEESVTLDLLPLILTIAREGRLEEEMYLTTFLWEEAKHTEFFRRFLDEVAHEHSDLHRYHTPSYRKIFYEELPQRMHALLSDPSPEAQARASVVYNMIVEGVLAETGYHAYFNMLERLNILPGLRQGVSYLKRDESRHLAYGVFLLSRLVAQEPRLWDVIQAYMSELLTYALGVINELFEARETQESPAFDLQIDEYLSYATAQFQKRLERIGRARRQSLEEIYQSSETDEPA